jgi:glycosyltransferase involved in cell wall biosynthesis
VRQGDRVTVLAPHAAGLPREWQAGGVEVVTFRYAPERAEVLGYGRSLAADVRVRAGAAAVGPLYALAAWRAVKRQLRRGRPRPDGWAGQSGQDGRPGGPGLAGGRGRAGQGRSGRAGRPERRFDLVHAHWLVPNGPAAAAAVGRIGGGRLVIGLHGSDVFLAERRGARALARWALGRARLLTGSSPELVARACKLGFPAARACVIPYGVDTEQFSPAPERRQLWRQRLGIGAGAPVLLGVGRMAAKKGFGVLAAALPPLLAALPELHVVLAGGGDLLPELAAATAAWRQRVHLPGAVPRDTLPDLYRAADLFVLPAVHDERGNVDGLPNVILEAMASGLPVVASGISGIPLAVEDGATGQLVPERNVAALGGALLRLLGDEAAAARRMGERGRRKAEAELTWDAIAARHRAAYERALAPAMAREEGPGDAGVA